MLVLGASGSLREDSYNRRLLAAAAAALPPGVDYEELAGLCCIPPYSEDLDFEPAPPTVRRMRSTMARADALLIATPEYNHSIPGQLKNALDWLSRPFPDNVLRNKPAAVIGASTSLFGAVWAQAETRKVLTAVGARVVDEELPVASAHDAFDPDGSLRDRDLGARLDRLVGHLMAVSTDLGLRRVG
jgi:chromate reductase